MGDQVIDNNKWHYTIVENVIIESEHLDIYEKMIYIALKRFANLHTQEAFPGVKRLAIYAGMSDRKARSVLSGLESKNYIEIERRTNQTSIYTILPSHAHGAGHEQGAVGVMHTVQGGHEQGADELKRTELEKVEREKDKVDKSTDVLFEEWWDLYGNKAGDKKKCRTKYKSLLKKNDHSSILDGTRRYKDHLMKLKSSGEFAPALKYPYTFLNGENFNDEYELKTPVRSNGNNPHEPKRFRPDSVDLGGEIF